MKPIFLVLVTWSVFSLNTPASLGQNPYPDPRALAREFENILRANRQPGGSVVSISDCTSKDSGEISEPLPQASSRLMQISVANPKYFVTNTEVPNFLPKNYEPELLKSSVRRYLLDSNYSPSTAFDELLKLEELQPAIEDSGLRNGIEVIIALAPPPWKPEKLRRTKLLKTLTLRDALNEMAAFYGTGKWRYLEYRDCDGHRITRIDFTIF
jgi:hypothetical protein